MVDAQKKKADYARLVNEAEAAVSAVKDPELKRVAFEKILGTLLQDSTPSQAPQRARANVPKPAKPPPKARLGPTAYIQELIDDGFFASPRSIADVKEELSNRGHHIPQTSLSGPLQSLTQQRLLRRQKTGGAGAKSAFAYSNW